MRKYTATIITLLFLTVSTAVAAHPKKHHRETRWKARYAHRSAARRHHFMGDRAPVLAINTDADTDSVSAGTILSFAQNLIGTPYREASSNPLYGFDCSGFVSYVFRSFNFDVPRSSSDFAYVGERINLEDALPGDILLFTGTKTHHLHSIGHIAIVYSNDSDGLKFIHSTSGKEHGVTITAMDDTYKRRFVQAVRLLKQNDGVLANR